MAAYNSYLVLFFFFSSLFLSLYLSVLVVYFTLFCLFPECSHHQLTEFLEFNSLLASGMPASPSLADARGSHSAFTVFNHQFLSEISNFYQLVFFK
jgi:hypothetical protein